MSRSYAASSRRSLSANSTQSLRAPALRFPSNKSYVSRLNQSRASHLSLVKRSLPQRVNPQALTDPQKACRVLESLAKTIIRYSIPDDKQLLFCMNIKTLQDLVGEPPSFWEQWFSLKNSVFNSLATQSDENTSIETLEDFCETEFTKYSLRLGKIRDLLPKRSESAINDKFLELNEYFRKMEEIVMNDITNVKNDDPNALRDLRYTVTKLEAFKKVVPNQYEAIFIAAIKDRNKRLRTIAKCTAHTQGIIQRIQEFLDPKLTLKTAQKDFEQTEDRLRKLINDFPQDQRIPKRSQSEKSPIVDEKKQKIKQLKTKKQALIEKHDELTSDLNLSTRSEQFTLNQISEENERWEIERREIMHSLQRPATMDLQKAMAQKEQLQIANKKLETEIKKYNASFDITEIKAENKHAKKAFASISEDVESSTVQLTHDRAMNEVLIELIDDTEDSAEPYHENTPNFLLKEKYSNQLATKRLQQFHLNQMRIQRSLYHPDKVEVTMNQHRIQTKANSDLLDKIDGLNAKIDKLNDRILKKRFENFTIQERITENKRLQSQIKQLKATKPQSEIQKLKTTLDFLVTKYQLLILESSQKAENGNHHYALANELPSQRIIAEDFAETQQRVQDELRLLQARNHVLKSYSKNADLTDYISKTQSQASDLKKIVSKQGNAIQELESVLQLNGKRQDDFTRQVNLLKMVIKLKSMKDRKKPKKEGSQIRHTRKSDASEPASSKKSRK